MFESRKEKTVIAKALKIVGSVTAEGLVEVNGQIDGELHGMSLVISHGAEVAGKVTAERVVVDGKVEGPIQGGDVVLKSKAHVIQHQSLAIETGAYFEGRLFQVRGPNGQPRGCRFPGRAQIATRFFCGEGLGLAKSAPCPLYPQ
jgi:cytoskeletal protein CcmA (bactofilin family)